MIPRTMRAVMLVEIGKLELQEVPVPQPGPREVLLRVVRASVCNGSDAAEVIVLSRSSGGGLSQHPPAWRRSFQLAFLLPVVLGIMPSAGGPGAWPIVYCRRTEVLG